MLRLMLYLATGVLVFLATLAGLLAGTGNLNSEALDRVMGRAPELEPPAARPVDKLGPLAQQLKQKELALQAREQELATREEELELREQELNSLRGQLESLQTELTGAVEQQEQARQQQLATVATTLTEMRPEAAAQSLNGFPPEDQAAILNMVTKAKDRGKILGAMEQDQARRVLQAMQNPI